MRPFADVLADLSGGTYDELGQALGELVEAVQTTRKAGTLKLSLKVSPNGVNSVKIADDVTVKLPAPDRATSVMFVDEDMSLRRSDPRQPKLPLKQVSGPEAAEEKAG